MTLGVFSNCNDSPASLICCQLHSAVLSSLMHGQGRWDRRGQGTQGVVACRGVTWLWEKPFCVTKLDLTHLRTKLVCCFSFDR